MTSFFKTTFFLVLLPELSGDLLKRSTKFGKHLILLNFIFVCYCKVETSSFEARKA